jgi:hypothetical protein
LPRWITYIVTLIATLAVLSAGGFVLARWNEWDGLVELLAPTLKYSLYAVVGCCVYAGLVGVYHTILSVTGLDESRGRGRERHQEAVAAESEPQ